MALFTGAKWNSPQISGPWENEESCEMAQSLGMKSVIPRPEIQATTLQFRLDYGVILQFLYITRIERC